MMDLKAASPQSDLLALAGVEGVSAPQGEAKPKASEETGAEEVAFEGALQKEIETAVQELPQGVQPNPEIQDKVVLSPQSVQKSAEVVLPDSQPQAPIEETPKPELAMLDPSKPFDQDWIRDGQGPEVRQELKSAPVDQPTMAKEILPEQVQPVQVQGESAPRPKVVVPAVGERNVPETKPEAPAGTHPTAVRNFEEKPGPSLESAIVLQPKAPVEASWSSSPMASQPQMRGEPVASVSQPTPQRVSMPQTPQVASKTPQPVALDSLTQMDGLLGPQQKIEQLWVQAQAQARAQTDSSGKAPSLPGQQGFDVPKGLPRSEAAHAAFPQPAVVMGGNDFVRVSQGVPSRAPAAHSLQGVSSEFGATPEVSAMKTQPTLSPTLAKLSKQQVDQLERLRIPNQEVTADRGINPMMAPPSQASMVKRLPPIEVQGHVTQGAMAQSRLSSQSLMDVSHRFKAMGDNSAGMMKIRLKPDSLGELTLQVQTQGRDVGIKFAASSPEARRVLEESLPYLKDNLAQSSLKLGKVEFGLMSTAQQGVAVASLDSLVTEGQLNRNLSDFSEGSRDLSDHRSWQEEGADRRSSRGRQDAHEEPGQQSTPRGGGGRGLNVLA